MKGIKMTLQEAKQKAQEISAQHQCGQHVNFRITECLDDGRTVGGQFYVSDWYDCDSTIKSYSCGKEL